MEQTLRMRVSRTSTSDHGTDQTATEFNLQSTDREGKPLQEGVSAASVTLVIYAAEESTLFKRGDVVTIAKE